MTATAAWDSDFAAVVGRIGPRLARAAARRHAADYLRGLLSRTERKNGWQLAEAAGDASPYGFQQFLYRATWDPDAVRDDLRAYVVGHLGEPQGVLVVDETGFLKKGAKSAGVRPQYRGAAGRTARAQVGVFLTYAGARGHTFLDRALYLPASWTDDRERCRAAGIPDAVAFATKPTLAQAMLERALDAGVPAAWVTADSIDGDGKYLRVWLEARPSGHVLAVSGKDTVVGPDWRQRRIGTYLADPPTDGWQRLSAGAGAKGPREYDWTRLPLVAPLVAGWARWVLLRRSVTDPAEVTASVCCAPADATLADLVRVAGSRWTVAICFAAAQQEVGLAEYAVRSRTGWHRHVTLACLAHAFLTTLRAHGGDPLAEAQKGDRPRGSLVRFRASRRGSSP
jgi:SRSO17 transposase